MTSQELVEKIAKSPIEDVTEEARVVLASGINPDEYVNATIDFHRGSIIDETWGTWAVEFTTAIARESAVNAGLDPSYEAYQANL